MTIFWQDWQQIIPSVWTSIYIALLAILLGSRLVASSLGSVSNVRQSSINWSASISRLLAVCR